MKGRVIFTCIILFLFLTPFVVFAGNYTAGTNAGNAVTTGTDGVYVGDYAGYYTTTGSGNVMLGMYSGYRNTTGKGNIYLGYMAGYSNTTSNYKLYITNGFYPASGIFGDLSTGYFGINNTSPSVALDVTGDAEISGTLTVSSTLTGLKSVEIVTESDTLTASQSGLLSIYRPIAAKALTELPPAAVGLNFEFMVADEDSLLIFAASGDSIITSTGAAYVTESSTAGTVKLVAIDSVRWIMLYTLGTWTGY